MCVCYCFPCFELILVVSRIFIFLKKCLFVLFFVCLLLVSVWLFLIILDLFVFLTFFSPYLCLCLSFFGSTWGSKGTSGGHLERPGRPWGHPRAPQEDILRGLGGLEGLSWRPWRPKSHQDEIGQNGPPLFFDLSSVKHIWELMSTWPDVGSHSHGNPTGGGLPHYKGETSPGTPNRWFKITRSSGIHEKRTPEIDPKKETNKSRIWCPAATRMTPKMKPKLQLLSPFWRSHIFMNIDAPLKWNPTFCGYTGSLFASEWIQIAF